MKTSVDVDYCIDGMEAPTFAYFLLCFALAAPVFSVEQPSENKGCCHTQHDVDVELGHVKLLSTSTKRCSTSL